MSPDMSRDASKDRRLAVLGLLADSDRPDLPDGRADLRLVDGPPGLRFVARAVSSEQAAALADPQPSQLVLREGVEADLRGVRRHLSRSTTVVATAACFVARDDADAVSRLGPLSAHLRRSLARVAGCATWLVRLCGREDGPDDVSPLAAIAAPSTRRWAHRVTLTLAELGPVVASPGGTCEDGRPALWRSAVLVRRDEEPVLRKLLDEARLLLPASLALLLEGPEAVVPFVPAVVA